MKTSIRTLQDAFAYQLQRMFYTEKKVREEFESCSKQITSVEVKDEITRYISNAENKLQKLERVFSYLMQEPGSKKNDVIVKMIDETHHLLSMTSTAHLKDVLMIGCIQNINAYKTAAYKTAYLFAVELELDTASDLLQQILEWEITTGKKLASLSVHEFNKLNGSAKA
jgi:ferritin-like metal-binding protein YciE